MVTWTRQEQGAAKLDASALALRTIASARTRLNIRETASPTDPRRTDVNQAQDRIMTPMEALFRAAADIPEETIHAVEGAVEQGRAVRQGADGRRPLRHPVDPARQGARRPRSPARRPRVGGDPRLGPAPDVDRGTRSSSPGRGTSGATRRGVPHYSEALEDCVQIEIKSPARKTWT